MSLFSIVLLPNVGNRGPIVFVTIALGSNSFIFRLYPNSVNIFVSPSKQFMS